MLRCALLAYLLAATAACSGTTAAADPPEAAASSSVSQAAPEADRKRLGMTQTTAGDDYTLSVTVNGMLRPFKTVVSGLPTRRSFEYAAVDVKLCVTDGGPAAVGISAWTLGGRGGVVVESLDGWNDSWWEQEIYPNGHSVRKGRCVRGWIPFEVRKGTPLSTVTYAPDGMEPLEWKLR
ncbi:hypothetical protein ACBJ59_12080 [Nonomuraea sp. MTCD27]|uniref:hypothetical protein n=1 Tax=Nonomuraea sp. MTCD27 TaxID=1676747 RepID=UPI0035BEE9B8